MKHRLYTFLSGLFLIGNIQPDNVRGYPVNTLRNRFLYIFSACMFLYVEAACQSGIQHHTFRGIYADDPAGTEGLYNPERGFRLEVALDVTDKNYVWAPNNCYGINILTTIGYN